MKQPIPRNSNVPLNIGHRVQIVPEWEDPGDGKYERFFIEAPDDCARVRIQAVVPGLFFQPVEWIEADKLVHLSPKPVLPTRRMDRSRQARPSLPQN